MLHKIDKAGASMFCSGRRVLADGVNRAFSKRAGLRTSENVIGVLKAEREEGRVEWGGNREAQTSTRAQVMLDFRFAAVADT